MKKIIISVIVSIGLLIGAILFINNETSNKVATVNRSYIVASVTNDDAYPFEMTFKKGSTAREIAIVFQPNYSHLFRKTKDGWLEVDDAQKIYSDIQMKITK